MDSDSTEESAPKSDKCLSIVPAPALGNLSLDDVKITVHGKTLHRKYWPELARNISLTQSFGDHFNGIPKQVVYPLCRPIPTLYRARYQQEFDYLRWIGGGASSSVYSAMHRLDGRMYALKLIRNISSTKSLKRAKNEVDVLALLDHPNVVRYFSCWIEAEDISSPIRPLSPSGHCSESSSETSQSTAPSSSPEVSWASRSGGDGGGGGVSVAPPSLPHSGDDSSSDESSSESSSDDDVEANGDRALAVLPNCATKIPPTQLMPQPLTLFIQMELCRYTLADWLNWRNSLPTPQPVSDEGSSSKAVGLLHSYPWSSVDRAEVRWLFDQTVKGVHYLHLQGIIHRDIKPANIFIQGPPKMSSPVNAGDGVAACSAAEGVDCQRSWCYHQLRVKIGDFGLSTLLERCLMDESGDDFSHSTSPPGPIIEELPKTGPVSSDTILDAPPKTVATTTTTTLSGPLFLLTGNLGTVIYTAPEVMKSNHRGRSFYNHKADVYSLGVVLFQLLYPCRTQSEFIFLIDQIRRHPPSADVLPRELTLGWPLESKLLRMMLSSQPSDRPDLGEILSELSSTSEVIISTRRSTADDQLMGSRPHSFLVDQLLYRNRRLEEENAELKRRLGLGDRPLKERH
uniref:non-specific serine/threonine protein kinase n=2 Tax=Mesocestoides corti TaxID=53468 RepID=A0A5K3ES96_MESCO